MVGSQSLIVTAWIICASGATTGNGTDAYNAASRTYEVHAMHIFV